MPANNTTTSKQTRVNVTIAKDSMTASIVIRKPSASESPINADEIRKALSNEDIIYGIDEHAIENAVSEGKYNTPIKVAEGVKPKKGPNSEFSYHFYSILLF